MDLAGPERTLCYDLNYNLPVQEKESKKKKILHKTQLPQEHVS